MEAYKQEFIEFMVESQVLKFGDFTLKSGRKSPFFMNAGAYGFTMSSNYNSRPLPSEILVTDGKCTVIREKQTYEDLYAKQSIPPHLK